LRAERASWAFETLRAGNHDARSGQSSSPRAVSPHPRLLWALDYNVSIAVWVGVIAIGTGADVMKRVAAPMVGGLATSFLRELLVYPPVYLLWRWYGEVRHVAVTDAADPNPML
jgi:hypothetical protein